LKKTHPNVKVVLIGNDAIDVITGISTWELMKNSCDSETLEMLEYKGPVPYTQMRKEILEAKLCLFPSYAEAFPVAWLEAMACNKPVVASDIGWASETIEDGISGLLCAPSDHIKYAYLISKVLDDESYAKSLGSKARERIEKLFSAKDIAKQNLEYYAQLVKRA